jgi:hypothetical protein
MERTNELIDNIKKLHTTDLGIIRIKKNLELETKDIVNWCIKAIKQAENIHRNGKNWYVYYKNYVLTINAHSYTIITAHKIIKTDMEDK